MISSNEVDPLPGKEERKLSMVASNRLEGENFPKVIYYLPNTVTRCTPVSP